MRINLFSDYRGVLTGEQFYQAGIVDVSDGIASALVAAGRAEYVDEPKVESEPEHKPRVKKVK